MRFAIMPWFSGYNPVTIEMWFGNVFVGKTGIRAFDLLPPLIISSKFGVSVFSK